MSWEGLSRLAAGLPRCRRRRCLPLLDGWYRYGRVRVHDHDVAVFEGSVEWM